MKPKPPTPTNRGLKLPGFRQAPQMVSREGQVGGNQEQALKSKGNKSGIGKGSKYIEEAKSKAKSETQLPEADDAKQKLDNSGNSSPKQSVGQDVCPVEPSTQVKSGDGNGKPDNSGSSSCPAEFEIPDKPTFSGKNNEPPINHGEVSTSSSKTKDECIVERTKSQSNVNNLIKSLMGLTI